MSDHGWRPIENAPRDKTTVLLWDCVVGILQAWWDGHEWVHSWDSEPIPWQDALTHWQPRPAPPGSAGERKPPGQPWTLNAENRTGTLTPG